MAEAMQVRVNSRALPGGGARRRTAWTGACRSAIYATCLLILAVLAAACESTGNRNTAPAPAEPQASAVQPPGSGPQAITVADGPPTNLLSADSRLAIDAGGADPVAAGENTTRVAVLLPRSGRHGDLGEAMWNAAQLALFDFAGGSFELLPYDTAGNPETAAQAAQKAVAEGARLIIGPLLSGSTRAVAEPARNAGVPVISFSSDASAASPGVFVMGFTPQGEVRRILRYARDRGLDRFAVITPDNAYGAVIAQSVNQTANALGSEVVRIDMVDPNSLDFSSVVERLASQGAGAGGGAAPTASFEALMIAELGQRVGAVAAYLPAYGIGDTVQILGTGTWDQPRIGNEPALVGGWYASADPASRSGFVAKYQQVYGARPPRLASLAYDATALAAVLSRTYGAAGFDQTLLTAPGGFYGSDGLFRFGPDGVAERGLAILEVDPGGPRIIDPAPGRFGAVAGS